MSKMTAMPLYGKSTSKFYSGTNGLISTKLGMKHLGPLSLNTAAKF